jgi:hypothetical protein
VQEQEAGQHQHPHRAEQQHGSQHLQRVRAAAAHGGDHHHACHQGRERTRLGGVALPQPDHALTCPARAASFRPGRDVVGERDQLRIGQRDEGAAHTLVELVFSQPTVHESGLERVDRLLAVGA